MTTQNVINRQGPTPVASIILTGNQVVSTASETVLQFNVASINNGSAFNTGTYQFLPTTIVPSYYYACLCCEFVDAVATYTVIAAIRLNGTDDCTNTTIGTYVGGTRTVLAAGNFTLNGSTDYLDFTFFQNSGGNITLTGGARINTRVDIFRIA